MYEINQVRDGDEVFNIKDTFWLCTHAYVLTSDADEELLLKLADHGYRIQKETREERYGDMYVAMLVHRATRNEIVDEIIKSKGHGVDNPVSIIVNLNHVDKPKISMQSADMTTNIITHAAQRSDLSYYNRPHDMIPDIAIARMSTFIKKLVDVDYGAWEDFIERARHYHAQDFILALAHWCYDNSSETPQKVKLEFGGKQILIDKPETEFQLSRPFPIGRMQRPRKDF